MQPYLDEASLLQVLQPEGLLSRVLKKFESRPQQQEMTRNVIQAYNKKQIALIEAGTGTGKSISYLLPAIIAASLNQQRTVISTNTITLQEQLLNKDIPMLIKALGVDVKAVLVKGMNNYVCLRKLDEYQQELRLMPLKDATELERIEAWKENTQEGSRSDLPFVPSYNTWEKVGAETDTCTGQKCPFFQKCYFFKARKQANDAQILVVNHHILFADLVKKGQKNDNPKEAGILPAFSALVIDEAHHIEDVATEFFGMSLSRYEILKSLSRLATEKQGSNQGKLSELRERIIKYYRNDHTKEVISILNRLTMDLPGLRRDLLHLATDAFDSFAEFIDVMAKERDADQEVHTERKLRLLPHHKADDTWINGIVPRSNQLVAILSKYVESLTSLLKDIEFLKEAEFKDQIYTLTYEINSLANRLSSAGLILENFLPDSKDTNVVRWMESQTRQGIPNAKLVEACLDISGLMVEYLFKKVPTVILCSATLTTNKHFSYFRGRLGLVGTEFESRVTQHIYESPFNYQQQALFAIPKDMAHPQDGSFIQNASHMIWQLIQVSHGNAFILFTSYSMMQLMHQLLAAKLEESRYYVFKQGDDNRQSLLQRFKAQDRSILFGTDSFWEGVDVGGDALRCVVIVKLPFKVPSEPIIQARTEAIQRNGGNAFNEYSLPQAIVKFKQGFGRLIRNNNDRGCIVCLDTRLLSKQYGKMFLNSLPNCQQIFVDSKELLPQMADFYRKTYHFVLAQKKNV